MISNDNKQSLKFSIIKPIEVIQPYAPQIIQFENTEDFNIYYSKHLDDFNETTYKLNTKYKIPGYKITKLKGQLKLIKDYNVNKKAQNCINKDDDEIEELKRRVEVLEKQHNLLIEQINNISKYLSQ